MNAEVAASAEVKPAYIGFWKRTLASFIDTIIVIIVTVPLLFAIYGREYFGRAEPGFAGVGDVLVQVVLPALFAILFWKYRGATPGKMLLGARIVDAETLGPPSTGRLVVRYFAYLASAIPLMLGFLWIAFDKRKQGWHDKLARTVVIEDEEA
jgi:uncharacterized RDD family membrane protein YckC